MKNIVNFSESERKARLRDLENDKILSDEEMQQANDLQAKANSKGMRLVPEKKIKNNFRFAQLLQSNWGYLRMKKYLTSAEKNFLVDLVPNIGFLSNCIVDDPKKKNQTPLTQTEIADLLGIDKANVSKIVKRLIDKGVIARSETGVDGSNARAYALYVNPNIMYSGNKDEVNLTLQTMFKKQPKELKDLPERLF
ncbi:MarR family transcriptional regulator [Peribacillus frigoritolerans]|uniref:MarR family transcriptional regulator n=1 Tax=Peribacillus frigoritolerans TaxID=450367 RepID=UPI003B8C3D85|nr:MarR family transcriptional regulator [Campylobacter jejuni]